ncbi:16S rRNA (cytosine(1402)-N(4))-methyltransferase RsmH [Anaeroselena agilis]|uniref:Ribosomal RNA small subunit methyltransferase H n=1 Tax=Anaeroselena agilis TaxID=3063788 RepID=A0ABU3NY10_9FIRM|nr:16S rRNA (cytosine(1402)-N(4))-methyltransferase RsmH [Selenomonadales bacterium 4137-cl]
MDFQHTSVLLAETVAALVTDPAGIYVDCTLGGGGHAAAVTGRLSPEAWFIGIDQDPAALQAAQARLRNASCRVTAVHGNFSGLGAILDDLGVPAATGILFDLGVSSHQLDVAERGFSYMHDGPLDMRMNPSDALTASEIVNTWDEDRLAKIIFDYGEERWAKKIARTIVAERVRRPLATTGELVETIKKAIPAAARREGPHPAKRTFQAIRIAVNDELGILRAALETAALRLVSGGRLCVITFHSLEDRIAKQTIQDLAKGCLCPKDFPVCVCGNTPKVKALGKPVPPSPAELEANPRSRSAKLRVAEKV